MKRRTFIKVLASTLGATTLRSAFAQTPNHVPDSTKVLKGFIVSDAHYGWAHHDQPTPEKQAQVMRTILARFPDLDVMLDTGDAFHSPLDRATGDLARANWTNTVPSLCKTLPFFYTVGNHDLDPDPEDMVDSEWRDESMGSLPCRPYFSFDLKGVHFISVPELQDSVFVTAETIEWLKLDLALNKDRTVVLLGHNNITGTTTPYDEGYRGLVNGQELLDIFSKYPNVISWLHGHNHTYQVVNKYNMLFVSNGRFGGFLPPKSWGVGQEQFGGMYFEIRPDKYIVRSFSADANKFFDEMGHPQLSGELPVATTVTATPAFAYSYGVGGMCDGQRIPAFNHHTAGKSELFVTGTKSPEINDDPTFVNYTHRILEHGGLHRWTLFSASVGYPQKFEAQNTTWKWENPGFRLLAQPTADKSIDVCVPDFEIGKFEYYRCAPANTYRVSLDLDSPAGGQTLELAFLFSDKLGKQLGTTPLATMQLKPGQHTYTGSGKCPPLVDHESIYTLPTSDNEIQITARARFTGLTQDVVVRRFSLTVDGATAHTADPEIILNGTSFKHTGELVAGKIVKFDIPTPTGARDLIECRAGGSRRASWLIRHQALDWQVRNATVADHGDHLEIGPLRNTWSPTQEVVIANLTGTTQPYVHRMENIQKARIYPLNRKNGTLKAEVVDCSDQAKIIVSSPTKPNQVVGAKTWDFADSFVTITVEKGARIEIS